MALQERLLRASGPTVGALVFIGVLASGVYAQEIESPPQEETILAQDTTATDSLPPTGSIQVPEDQRITNQTRIQLLLQASDTESTVDSMQFSLDGETWMAPEPYGATKEWELAGEDGLKTIFVRFRDSAGNWMKEAVSVEVTLDREPPQNPSLVINDGAELTNNQQVELRLSADGANAVQVSEDSSFADATWVPLEESLAFTLTAGDGAKTVYARFRDQAGNVSETASGEIVLDTTPPLNPMVSINNGIRFTNRRDVEVALSAEEAVEMMVAEGSLENAVWQPVDSLITLTLEGPEGERIVFAKFRDRAGNETKPVTAGIILDQTPPQNPLVVLAGGRDFVNDRQVIVSLSAEGAAEMLLQGDFLPAAGDTGWTDYRNQITIQLTEEESPKTIRVQYRDEAGNVSEEVADEVVLDLTAPQIVSLEVVDLQPRMASLTWETDEVTRAEINLLGESPGDERVLVDSSFVTDHEILLKDLQPGTSYRVLLTALDRAENSTQAEELAFVTLSETVVQARVVFPRTLIPVVGAMARLGDLETESDEQGAFQFVYPPVGDLPIIVEKEGFDTYADTLTIPKTGKIEQKIELASDTYTHAISGTVTDRHGNPLPGTRVVLFNPDETESELYTTTDDSGRYVLSGVPQGERKIRIYADYFLPVEPTLDISAATELDEALAAAPIHPPERVAAAARSIRSVGIEWEPILYPTALGYVLYRAPAPDSEFVAIHEGFLPPSQEAYVDSGLSIGTSYVYAMAVVNIDSVFGKFSRKVAAATLNLFTPNQTLVSGLERQVSHAAPTLADLDGDGDLDLLMSEGTGSVRGYRNIGSAAMPRWQRDDALVRGILGVGGNSRVALADLDADGDVDLLRGIGDGRFRGYRNTGSVEVPQWKPDAALSQGVKEGSRNLSPTLADLDGDGDYDLVIGTYRPSLIVYENLGEPDHPKWQRTERFTEGLSGLPNNAAPLFTDVDGDGDLDLFVGEDLGSIICYENVGTPEVPKWQLNPEFITGLLDVGDQAVPTLGDLDGDGDLDLLVGAWNGKVLGFENNTIASVRVLAGVKALK